MVVDIRRVAAADQARLLGDERQPGDVLPDGAFAYRIRLTSLFETIALAW